MAYRTAILGASGYTGAELLRLLAAHPEITVVSATANAHAGQRVGDLYPALDPAYPKLIFEDLSQMNFEEIDLAFLALPHGESQNLVPDLVGQVKHITDLAADFRLPASLYKEWYGEDHRAAELINDFAYGLPETFRGRLNPEVFVAAPGCYPTASALALAPLLAHGMIESKGIIIDALSGISGRGHGLSVESLYSEANENANAYGLLTHRHTGEIEFSLSHVYGSAVEVLFTPHLVPMTRGILTTCHSIPAVDGLTSQRLLDLYNDYYANEPFVIVSDNPPSTKSALGSNFAYVTARYDSRTNSILTLAAIDNLVKGAAGQAIQATNCVLGLPEALGLLGLGLTP